jgi:hypothetical protein
MSGMNPDATINVVAVFPDGLAVWYGHANKVTGVRARLYSREFANYGLARDEAWEYERAQREERDRRAK